MGETARGGPIQNKGFTVTDTGNFAPDVVGPGNFTIPPRTPFALTGSATDPNGDPLTYMWEQVDRAGISGGSTVGTALLSNTKTNGALFRQFGAGVDIPLADSLKYNSPGLEPGHGESDAGLPGHGPDPGRQHQRGHRVVPRGAAGARGRPDRGPRVLRGVAADGGLDRLPQRSHDDLPADRA